MSSMLIGIVAGLFLAGVVFLYLVLLSWRRRYFTGCLICTLIAVVLILSGMGITFFSLGLKGYTAFTREELAATVSITPLGNQQFQAKVVRPGAHDTLFAVAGDEFYIDARILKWKPFLNVVGLHTAYCLDRITGRYLDVQDERTKVRTVFLLSEKPGSWDFFFLRTRFGFLSPLIDAQYGSATFQTVKDAKVLKVMVTTSGLMIRTE